MQAFFEKNRKYFVKIQIKTKKRCIQLTRTAFDISTVSYILYKVTGLKEEKTVW